MGLLVAIQTTFNPTRKPMTVTVNAAILIHIGIVVVGVLNISMFFVISLPATMLLVARRVIGFMIVGIFSCRRYVEFCRGCPVCTSSVIRSV